jgi:hypothetical protein
MFVFLDCKICNSLTHADLVQISNSIVIPRETNCVPATSTVFYISIVHGTSSVC